MFKFNYVSVRVGLGISGHLIMRANGSKSLRFCLQPANPLLCGALEEDFKEFDAHLRSNLFGGEICVESWMIYPIEALHGPTHSFPEMFRASSHGNRSIRSGKHSVQRMHKRMSTVGFSYQLSCQEIVRVLGRLHPYLSPKQTHINALPPARFLTREQRCQYSRLEVLRPAMVCEQ